MALVEARGVAGAADDRDLQAHAQVDVESVARAELNVLEDRAQLEIIKRRPHCQRSIARTLRPREDRDLVTALEAVHGRDIVRHIDRGLEIDAFLRRGLYLEVAAVVGVEERTELGIDADVREIPDPVDHIDEPPRNRDPDLVENADQQVEAHARIGNHVVVDAASELDAAGGGDVGARIQGDVVVQYLEQERVDRLGAVAGRLRTRNRRCDERDSDNQGDEGPTHDGLTLFANYAAARFESPRRTLPRLRALRAPAR